MLRPRIFLGSSLLLAAALGVAGCGSSGSSSTEQGAIDNLRSVLSAYNATRPTDVTSTGAACATALSGLQGSSLLAANPNPGKELAVRSALHSAYLFARQGFSDCTAGARAMNYPLMARADSELTSADESLSTARSARE